MAVTVIMACGHGLALIDVRDPVPETGPWALWPDPDIDPGDSMTCVIDHMPSIVTEVRPGLVPMGDNGWEIV
jgi:hypothetical protein